MAGDPPGRTECRGAARVWDAATGTEAARPESQGLYVPWPSAPIPAPSRPGRTGYISLWNLADGKLRQTLTGHEGSVLGVAFSADGLYLASAGQDRTVRVWDVEAGTSVRVIRGHTDMVTGVAFSPDGDRLVTGSHDGTARVWDLTFDDETGGGEIEWAVRSLQPPEAIAFARGGRELRIFMRNGAVVSARDRLVRRARGRVVTDLGVGWQTPAELAAFDAEGRRVVAVDARAVARRSAWTWMATARRTTLRGHTLEHPLRHPLGRRDARRHGGHRPGRRSRATRSSSGTPPPGAMLHRREVAGESIARIALDPTGRRLALSAVRTVPTADGTGSRPAPFVAVVDVDTGRELLRREVLG